ncbi:MAG: alpha/beta hydrolase [Rhodospirillales bacterium]|nr:alpha/beta hydrolase [Rhodospirillales bacterium]
MIFFIVVALGSYTALVGVMFLQQRQLIYFPDTHLPSPTAAGLPEMRQVSVTSEDGLKLSAWFHPAKQDQPTLVFFQGNGGNISGRGFKARHYMDAGFGVLLVGYRGYGGNPGKPSEQGLYMDGRGHLDFLNGEGVRPGQWVLYGESLGTGVAVQLAMELATKSPVGAVVLEAPYTSLGDVAAKHYPYIPARHLVSDRYDSISKIGKIRAPLFIVQGEMDGVIPVEQGKKLLDAAIGTKEALWVKGGGHNNLYEFGIAEVILKFVGKYLPNR